MTAPDVNADVRARFEAWAVRQFGPSVSLRWVAPPSGDGYYKDDPADDCWDAYRAAHADLAGEVRELVEDYRSLYRAYVNTLEVARDRIRQLGGECDPVDVMERGDPALSLARERLAKHTHQETK